MDDLDLDLDSFIENIEQTAPQLGEQTLCQQCHTPLEEVNETWVCPNCGAQATEILQLEETELNYDEVGRPLVGAGVRIEPKKKKNNREDGDYGWAWSTDDAISHILDLQIDALDRARLLPSFFRDAALEMWFKFWLEFVAPYIKDKYEQGDLVQIDPKTAMKMRDIEVLVRVQDKVMVPLRLINSKQKIDSCKKRRRTYNHLGMRYHSTETLDSTGSNDSPASNQQSPESTKEDNANSLPDRPQDQHFDETAMTSPPRNNDSSLTDGPRYPVDSDLSRDQCDSNINCDNSIQSDQSFFSQLSKSKKGLTRNLSQDSISILTLNRTLAFIEATARCLEFDDPLFASDIIRACNQRLIPFYGAQKTLPEEMKLNARDRLMLQKTRPPSPEQLSRAASLLIYQIYKPKLPFRTPTPSMDSVMRRFVKDLNLPVDFYESIKGRYSYNDFTQTRPLKFTHQMPRYFPQYDRWAFAVLIWHMKNAFNLNNKYINKQKRKALNKSAANDRDYFILADWLKQMSTKLKIILTYDPYVLFHPMTAVNDLKMTPQMIKYIETLIGDRIILQPPGNAREYPEYDEQYRNELTEFLCNEMPRPIDCHELHTHKTIDQELEFSSNIRHPISDAMERTRKYWLKDLAESGEQIDLITKDFSHTKLTTVSSPVWTYEDHHIRNVINQKAAVELDPGWPSALKLLLLLGSFMCFCEPTDLIDEVMRVEARIHHRQRTRSARKRSSQVTADDSIGSIDNDDVEESVS